jgi:hypothetical protein
MTEEPKPPPNKHLIIPMIESLREDLGESAVEDIDVLFEPETRNVMLDVVEWALEVGQCVVEAEQKTGYIIGLYRLPDSVVWLCEKKLPVASPLKMLAHLDFLGRPTAYRVLQEHVCNMLAKQQTTLDSLIEEAR